MLSATLAGVIAMQCKSQEILEVSCVNRLPQTAGLKMVCTTAIACQNRENALKSMFF
jgi:hypothetical protein